MLEAAASASGCRAKNTSHASRIRKGIRYLWMMADNILSFQACQTGLLWIKECLSQSLQVCQLFFVFDHAFENFGGQFKKSQPGYFFSILGKFFIQFDGGYFMFIFKFKQGLIGHCLSFHCV